jgi:hypothetical protein
MKNTINQANTKIKFRAGQTMRKTLFITMILVISAVVASAQHGYRLSKRISFRQGEVSSSVKGTILSRLEGHEYFFRVRRGQTVSIKLVSARKDMTFYLMDAEGNSMDEEVELREWTGELPESGDYHLVIGTKSKGPARYTLKVQIATDI